MFSVITHDGMSSDVKKFYNEWLATTTIAQSSLQEEE